MNLFSKKNQSSFTETVNRFAESSRFSFRFLAALWLIHAIQYFLDLNWAIYGIYPRTEIGLRGIIFAPLLHADWTHLISNTLPFWVLATLLFYFFPRVANYVFLWLYVVTGFLVWALGRAETFHVGLSYVIYGLVSFVFWTGVFRRSVQSITLAIIVLLFYSGMFVGIVPSTQNLERNISWESHLLGALVGIYLAYHYRHEYEEEELVEYEKEEEEMKNTFFQHDVFDYTRKEREEAERRRQEEEKKRFQNPFNDWFSNHT